MMHKERKIEITFKTFKAFKTTAVVFGLGKV